jgi:predicted porin
VYSGYHFATRRVRYVEAFDVPPFGGDREAFEQDNTLHSGVVGLRFKPAQPLTLNFDAEVGRADRPFTAVSEKNYHALGARVQYKAGSLLLSAAYKQNYNFNSVSLSAYSSQSRNYSGDLSWAPRGWLSFDAGYSKLHLDTTSGLAFFGGGSLIRTNGYYRSEIHAGNAGARFALGKRVEWYMGYTVTRDAADASRMITLDQLAASAATLPLYQVFPVRFESPLARLSIRLHERLRWNAGYQHYRYREELATFQNYRAHTGYTSLLWSF